MHLNLLTIARELNYEIEIELSVFRYESYVRNKAAFTLFWDLDAGFMK